MSIDIKQDTLFDAIIVGGSFTGLSAALVLGRSMRNVLVIDAGDPCNRRVHHANNFLTQDRKTPKQILKKARKDLAKYETVKIMLAYVMECEKVATGFQVKIHSGEVYKSKKILFATGVLDLLPDVKGFAKCWGRSILHCVYCHGYEVRNEEAGIVGDGPSVLDTIKTISHWSTKITVFTHGPTVLTEKEKAIVKAQNIEIVEKEIVAFEHKKGMLTNLLFKDDSKFMVSTIYAKVHSKQHCELPVQMGVEMTEQGNIKVDLYNRTSIHGLFAAGDNTSTYRTISSSVSAGTKAGMFVNGEIIDEEHALLLKNITN